MAKAYTPVIKKGAFLRAKDRFEAWLAARGAEVLVPTNEWELCRFRHGDSTAIVYTNKGGQLTWMGGAGDAYYAYIRNASWRAAPATKRTSKSTPVCKALRQRDGDACFFCHLPVAVEDESPEHLVAVTHGGPDHIANMALAHRECNAAAGHLPLMEKIRMREENLARIATPGTIPHLLLPPEAAEAFQQIHDAVQAKIEQAYAVPAAQVAAEEVHRETSPPWSST